MGKKLNEMSEKELSDYIIGLFIKNLEEKEKQDEATNHDFELAHKLFGISRDEYDAVKNDKEPDEEPNKGNVHQPGRYITAVTQADGTIRLSSHATYDDMVYMLAHIILACANDFARHGAGNDDMYDVTYEMLEAITDEIYRE